MLLYHGTSSRWLDQILAQGIRPRRKTRSAGNWRDTVNSHPNHVYLTTSYAPYFAECALNDDLKAYPVIIVVDTMRIQNLVADEDAIEQVERIQRKNEAFSKSDVYERTKRFSNMAVKLAASRRFTHHDSLDALGTCAVVDAVPRQAIIGYIRLVRSQSWSVWDPSITIENYRFMGDYYRYCSEYLWLGKTDKILAAHHQYRMSPELLHKRLDKLIIERKNVWKEMLGLEQPSNKRHVTYRSRKQLKQDGLPIISSPSLLEHVIIPKSTLKLPPQS